MTSSSLTSAGTLPLNGRFLKAGLAIFAACDILYVGTALSNLSRPRSFGDFFAFWSDGKLAIENPSSIYDSTALETFQSSLDPGFHGFYPYWNPPSFLLALAPLGQIPLAPAFAIWVVGTLHLYLLATVGRNWRSLAGVAVLAAPTTLVMIVSGQNGFLTAALLVGGLQNLDRRPTLSGVFFGLLTYKPQFFLLIPVVLLARRSVRAILSGCATFLTTFLLSGAFFGFALWTQWLSKIFPYSDLLNTHFELERLMPTILAGCHVTAVPKTISVAIYLATAVAFGFITWKANREHKTSEVMSITIVCVFLTAPYAFIYDTPMITSALFYEYQRRKSMARPFTMWEVELALVNLVLVFGMISTTLPFALFLGLCTLLWAVIRVRPNAPRPEIVVAG